ncbi:hypothetical protein ElyMa_002989400 [Elysia marginata]|uniref:Uncharacterized protein n=1 Tax=Elysia marginata TaxID=1093978 RepID=A0AAV4IBW5_9GAST|nr:hypothetical protein ElyMa_002989400 [Elysia marginata]
MSAYKISPCDKNMLTPKRSLQKSPRGEEVLQDMRNAKIGLLDKNRGERRLERLLHKKDSRSWQAKTKIQQKSAFLLADDAASTTHTEGELQLLMDRFIQECKAIQLKIIQKKTKPMVQDTDSPPIIRLTG